MRLTSSIAALGVAFAITLGISFLFHAGPSREAIQTALQSLSPDIVVESVAPSRISGLTQVQISDGEVLLVDDSLKHVFHGTLFEITDGRAVNLTEQAKEKMRTEALSAIAEKDLIVYPAKNKKGSITVFTDTDCPYCQKMHAQIPELNEQGIEVRYAAFPRMGINSPTHNKMSAAWCAPDRKEAITRLFDDQPIETISCDDPVAEQLELGRRIGVQGTPAIFLENGKLIGGLLPAKQIAEIVAKEARSVSPTGK